MSKWPYNTSAWRNLRRAKLSANPVCEVCTKRGKTVLAVAVDHILAINAGGEAFPALDGLMSMCEPCHNSKTARNDRGNSKAGSRFKGCDINGDPLDADDEWLKPGAFRGPGSTGHGPCGESKSELVAKCNQSGDDLWV